MTLVELWQFAFNIPNVKCSISMTAVLLYITTLAVSLCYIVVFVLISLELSVEAVTLLAEKSINK